LAGDGSGNEGSAALFQQINAALGFVGEKINATCIAIE
jgi:hypothetical protein